MAVTYTYYYKGWKIPVFLPLPNTSSPYRGGILVETSMCTTISAGRPPTAIMPAVGFLENVANFIVNAGGYLVRAISSTPGAGDITSTCSWLCAKKKNITPTLMGACQRGVVLVCRRSTRFSNHELPTKVDIIASEKIWCRKKNRLVVGSSMFFCAAGD